MVEHIRRTIDLDIHGQDYRDRTTEYEAEIRTKCPIGWSDKYGGHWAISSYHGLGEGLRDDESVTAGMFIDEHGNPAGGVTIPSTGEYRALPLEAHNAEWAIYRKLVSKTFGPRAVEALQPVIDKYATEVIDHMIGDGHADFVMQVASPITAMVSCVALGLPVEDWRVFAEGIHQTFSGVPGDGTSEQGIPEILRRIESRIEERRRTPGSALLDTLIAAKVDVDGRHLDDDEVRDLIYGILVGGVDTTAGLLSGSVDYLADKPDVRHRMLTDSAFMQTATEEFLRYISPAVGLARTATRDFDLAGQSICKGERLWFMFRAANRDPEVFDDPESVNLERRPNPHIAFGTGMHRCLGSHLARAMYRTTIRQFMTRIPDYQVERDEVRKYQFASVNAGYAYLPITFTPGPKLLTQHEFDHI